MRVSRSGFYAWRRRSPDDYRQALLQEVREIHRQKRGSYGSRRMARELRRHGYHIGRYQARSLMREAGVEARQRRRWRHTTDSQHTLPVAPNLLNRQFKVAVPNRAWVADITAIWTLEGWLYLAGVLDLHDRQLVGWALADHMRTPLVLDALEMAVGRRQPARGLIHHSDRGSQYASHEYRGTLARYGFQVSMSRKGNCWDNAVMERFFGSLKSEWLADQRYTSRQAARRDVIEYIEMEYNSCRLHSTLDYQTPREIELAAAA
jgi:putative transposase